MPWKLFEIDITGVTTVSMRPDPLIEKFSEGCVSIDKTVFPILEKKQSIWDKHRFWIRKTLFEKIHGLSKCLKEHDSDSVRTEDYRWLLLDTEGRWYRIIRVKNHLDVYLAESWAEEIEVNNHEKRVIRWSLKACDGKWYCINRSGNTLKVEGKCYPRHYSSSSFPTLVRDEKPDGHKELLQLLYQEVNTNWRNLTDVRFKLLGLLPAVSIIAWGQLVSDKELQTFPYVLGGLMICLLGLSVSIGIRIYDKRNDSLYDDLISRGRKLEEELKIETGIFRGRRRPTFWLVNHTWAIRIIYGSVILGWLGLLLWFGWIATKLNWVV